MTRGSGYQKIGELIIHEKIAKTELPMKQLMVALSETASCT